jgi:Tfp pilus assembly protein PilW
MEVMVALAASTVVIAALLTSYSMTARGFVSAGNYFDLEQDARITLEKLANDARQSTGLTSFAASDITLAVATNFTSSGTCNGAKTVRYCKGSGSNNNKLYRLDTGQTNVVADNISSLQFIAYDRNMSTNSIQPSDCKLLQVDITLKKYTLDNPNTEQILSARIVLRNKLLP